MDQMSPTAASAQGSDQNLSDQRQQQGLGSPEDGDNLLTGLGINQKKTKADGQPPKRRGPKPDSKPALNRRQELNRQAQRTHRQRKEQYTHALEQEVLKLRDYSDRVRRERDEARQDNNLLRELLSQNGITPPATTLASSRSEPGLTYGSATYGSSSSSHSRSPPATQDATAARPQGPHSSQSPNRGLDYGAIGTDFVLTLEGPCRDHMQMLCVKASKDENDFSGHVLMASCPPQEHIVQRPEVQYPHQIPEMHSSTLMMLLNASEAVSFEDYGVGMEEITPVKAWSLLLSDERVKQLTLAQFHDLKDQLLPKIRCYGFGAVLEEFEVLEGLQIVLNKAQGHPQTSGGAIEVSTTTTAMVH